MFTVFEKSGGKHIRSETITGVALTEIVGGKGGVLELAANLGHVLVGAPDEEDCFQVHQLLARDVVDHIDEEHLLLKDLGARVDH